MLFTSNHMAPSTPDRLEASHTSNKGSAMPTPFNSPAKTVGTRIDARCTLCGGRNMQITEERIGSDSYEVQGGKISTVVSASIFKATGRIFGRCRQCGHDWVFRKNPLTP